MIDMIKAELDNVRKNRQRLFFLDDIKDIDNKITYSEYDYIFKLLYEDIQDSIVRLKAQIARERMKNV